MVLGIVQGLTEFLPISSSGHLILVPLMFGWADQGLPHDVAAHAGSLAAVLLYFRADLAAVVMAPFRPAGSAGAKLLLLLAVGTIPAIIAGALLHDIAATLLRNPLVVATTTMSFGVLLWWADWRGVRRRSVESMTWRDALVIGTAQCLALVPGTSRSGITMTAGLMLGMDRAAAARFSFLLSAPTILLAVIWEGRLLLMHEAGPVDWGAMGITTVFSAVCALITIHYFLKWLAFTGMAPYVIYRLLLGTVLFAVFL
jgi:undecaprenyl-diphosphatase